MLGNRIVILTTIPGIVFFSTLLIYSEICDIKHFQAQRGYAGLVSSTRQSRDKSDYREDGEGRGKLLKCVLVQCGFIAIRNDKTGERDLKKL